MGAPLGPMGAHWGPLGAHGAPTSGERPGKAPPGPPKIYFEKQKVLLEESSNVFFGIFAFLAFFFIFSSFFHFFDLLMIFHDFS